MHENKVIFLELASDLDFIEIDKIQFKQVIDNLITNAIKFSHKSNGEVCVSARKSEKFFYLDIEDNGK
jgi:signal transduction histidine kinase